MAPAPSRRRVSYLIPPPAADTVPILQLPPHDASRLGHISPLLLPLKNASDVQPSGSTASKWTQFSRHRLGVASLALDTSTQLVGRPSPEGILYTGGRDGLVVSWDLGIPMKTRTRKYGAPNGDAGSHMRMVSSRWEMMTGWADDIIDEDVEEEVPRSDGDILGDVKGSGKRRRLSLVNRGASIPFEEQWETDLNAFEEGQPSSFRQSTQSHSDWVNDIVLCNYNQTLISASSDGSVKAWNPHSNPATDPSVIGMHSDYVRCLGHCREQNYVASGSFDRTIKLWDLTRTTSTSQPDPLVTMNPPESSGPKSSVYALAVDPFGHTIVSGGPERVIRIWDPRVGKRVGKLVGHTDNIRAILVSEDSRYLLTASADASIKLWSLASQRCLHTFTHHTDSVWSLHSSHPSLEIFYSGDRSGIVSKVDVEGCTDMSEGECIVLCQDTNEHGVAEGINKIVAMDDNLVWTASGNASLKRWRVPPRRAVRASAAILPDVAETPDTLSPPESPFASRRKSRSIDTHRSRPRSITLDYPPVTVAAPPRPRHSNSLSAAFAAADLSDASLNPFATGEGETTWYGIPFESLVRLTSPHDPFTPFSQLGGRGRDMDVATLYSAASVMSIPRGPSALGAGAGAPSPLQSIFPAAQLARAPSPVLSDTHTHAPSRLDDGATGARSARAEFEAREVVGDAVPLRSTPDAVIEGEHGLVRAVMLNDRIHVLTVNTAGEVAVWNIVRGACVGRYRCEDVTEASVCGGSSSKSEVSAGKERSPRELLEVVRERIEGEAVVMPWATVDTRVGVLTVHVTERCFDAEVYADEVGCVGERVPDDHRINIGKWVLRNLFLGFIREEQRAYARRTHATEQSPHTAHRLSPHMDSTRSTGSASSATRRRSSSSSSHKSAPASPRANVTFSSTMLPAMPPNVSGTTTKPSPLITPKIPLLRQLSPVVQSPDQSLNGADPLSTPMPANHSKMLTEGARTPAAPQNDYFSLRVRGRSGSLAGAPPTPDDFSGWTGPGAKPGADKLDMPVHSGGGGLIGRLKSFGKSRRPPSEHGPLLASGGLSRTSNVSQAAADTDAPAMPVAKTPAQILLAGTISPPTSPDLPTVRLLGSIPIAISEEASPAWLYIYRGTVAGVASDTRVLEEIMPMWLLEYLLLNKAPATPITKIGFVLLPWQSKDPEAEKLPELLNVNQSKLTASRFLRVRKLAAHVNDKINKLSMSGKSINTSPGPVHISPRTSTDTHHTVSSASPKPANEHEPKARPEDLWEILCNETVLPPEMTLAAVRQFVWRQTDELTMFYRRRRTHDHAEPPILVLNPVGPGGA
ncbi:WD40 repeat-like protein [Dentipellis sp. KUC8613]|nr:WD40 repeat-like protein [Dentipellis sp. KUC8613]